MRSGGTQSASWRENSGARSDRQTNLHRTGINSSALSASLCPDIDAQVRLGLLVLVLQNVKLRHVAVNAGAAVADVERRSLRRVEPDRGHSKIQVVGVVGVGPQIVGSIVSCAIVVDGVGHEGKDPT